MLFQFGGQMTQVISTLQSWGFVNALLPFALIFAILYAILDRIQIFGKGQKKVNVVISLVISLLIVIPHIMGQYPANTDPINIINQMLPTLGILLVSILLVLILLGLVLGKQEKHSTLMVWIVAISVGILLYTIASAIWPTLPFGNLFIDPTTVALVIVLLVFGLIVWFITKEGGGPKPKPTKALRDILGMGDQT